MLHNVSFRLTLNSYGCGIPGHLGKCRAYGRDCQDSSSKDAGFHTTWDLMLETARMFWLQDHPTEHCPNNLGAWFEGSEYAKRSYAEMIQEVYPLPTQQQEFLGGFLGGREFGQAHDLVAELAARGIVRAVITPNFNPCIEDAIKAKGMSVAVISTDEQLGFAPPRPRSGW